MNDTWGWPERSGAIIIVLGALYLLWQLTK